MDKKETVNAYDEEAVDRAIEGMGMWCVLHKGEFLDKAWASFRALCGDEVDLDGCEGIAQAVLNYAFTEWIMFDSMVFGHGCIDEYLDRVEGVSNKNKAILSEIKGAARYGFFRYDGLFDDGSGDKGIVVSDVLEGGSFKVYSAYLHGLAIERSFEPGTGLSARFAILDGRAYFVGQFPAHDKAPIDESETLNLYRKCLEIGYPFIVAMAASTLAPNGMFSGSMVARVTESAA